MNQPENKYLTATAGVGPMDSRGEPAFIDRASADNRQIDRQGAQGGRIELRGVSGQNDEIG
jgi:hypothetical protein